MEIRQEITNTNCWLLSWHVSSWCLVPTKTTCKSVFVGGGVSSCPSPVPNLQLHPKQAQAIDGLFQHVPWLRLTHWRPRFGAPWLVDWQVNNQWFLIFLWHDKWFICCFYFFRNHVGKNRQLPKWSKMVWSQSKGGRPKMMLLHRAGCFVWKK